MGLIWAEWSSEQPSLGYHKLYIHVIQIRPKWKWHWIQGGFPGPKVKGSNSPESEAQLVIYLSCELRQAIVSESQFPFLWYTDTISPRGFLGRRKERIYVKYAIWYWPSGIHSVSAIIIRVNDNISLIYKWWQGQLISVLQNVAGVGIDGSQGSHNCPEAYTSLMKRACVPFPRIGTLRTAFTSWPLKRKLILILRKCKEHVVTLYVTILTSPIPWSGSTLLKIYCKSREGSLNGAQRCKSNSILKDSPALWWSNAILPHAITVTYTNNLRHSDNKC